ncbi:hypothetical protein [Pseudomonas sp. Marseille-Q5115]|uniref:hypothetical protein n=1 Tax=Pseudomonas sp. Marseille-Q5115 TaxID=2866593 RepID=UPI001CE3F3CA|nr:hypothetical protein [Pseudomonas sp. Marseille-Q5115]
MPLASERLLCSPEPRVGLVIATFAALPYVHLALESRCRFYPQVPVLVHDDGSRQGPVLRQLCAQYGVAFSCNPHRLRHTVGDLSAFVEGLEWAEHLGLELLVKMSRRFIPLVNWLPCLQQLAWHSQYATYSQRCTGSGFGFRTECIGLHVPSWRNGGPYESLRQRTCLNEPLFVEGYVHNLARSLHRSCCDANRHYEAQHPRPSEADAYGAWPLMPESRWERSAHLLWHDCDTPVDYARLAVLYGLPYSPLDFEDPNQGAGLGVDMSGAAQ